MLKPVTTGDPLVWKPPWMRRFEDFFQCNHLNLGFFLINMWDVYGYGDVEKPGLLGCGDCTFEEILKIGITIRKLYDITIFTHQHYGNMSVFDHQPWGFWSWNWFMGKSRGRHMFGLSNPWLHLFLYINPRNNLNSSGRET